MRKLIFLTILSSLFFTNSFAYQFALNSKDKNLINNSKQKSAILKRLEKYSEFKNETKNLDIDKKLGKVNFFINKTLPEFDTQSVGIDDYWMTPKEFFIKGFGDCEDYATAKYKLSFFTPSSKSVKYFAIA
jgi:predicted transglutaminase-like cysteine proteinase